MAEDNKVSLDLGMNLYEFNKQAMNQFEPMDAIKLNIQLYEIANKIKEKFVKIEDFQANKYWMLLNNENKDYTVFHLDIDFDKNRFINDLRDCLTNRGKVLDITRQEDGNWEIWIRETVSGENLVYYFFNYAFGVIEVL